MTPDEYCQDKTAKSGSSFYYSFLFLPPDQRRAITAVYAFCREVDDVVDEISDQEIAQNKLNWWRDEIARLFDGTPQHPVTKSLAVAIKDFNLPQDHFIEILDGMEMDLHYDAYPSFKELSLYCHRVASIVGIMAVEIFGHQDRQTIKYAHNLGMAFQLTNILRDVKEDVERGRVYIPLDELKRFNISPEDLQTGSKQEQLKQLFQFQAQRAREYYTKAFELLPDSDRNTQRSGIIMAKIYLTILDEIEKNDFNVLKKRTSLTPLRKLWIAWKTAREEKKRYKYFLKLQH